MGVEVVCYNEFRGKHRWKSCPPDFPHSYLRNQHRHIFVVRTMFAVTDDDRQIEIFDAEDKVRMAITTRYPVDADGLVDFGDGSCEMIARYIVEALAATECCVLEDGRGGARVRT